MLADDDLIRAAPQEFSITPDLAMKMVPLFRQWRVSAEWTEAVKFVPHYAYDLQQMLTVSFPNAGPLIRLTLRNCIQ